jgi:hypothetical protein
LHAIPRKWLCGWKVLTTYEHAASLRCAVNAARAPRWVPQFGQNSLAARSFPPPKYGNLPTDDLELSESNRAGGNPQAFGQTSAGFSRNRHLVGRVYARWDSGASANPLAIRPASILSPLMGGFASKTSPTPGLTFTPVVGGQSNPLALRHYISKSGLIQVKTQ